MVTHTPGCHLSICGEASVESASRDVFLKPPCSRNPDSQGRDWMPEKVALPHRRICQKASIRSQIPAVEMRACFQSFCHTCGESDGRVLCKEGLEK